MTYAQITPRPVEILPTIPGKTSGIVGVNPWRLQCQVCLRLWEAEPDALVSSLIMRGPMLKFWARKSHEPYDKRRMCRACWEAIQ